MTGSENVQIAIDNLVNVAVPALQARVQVLIDSINGTAADGLTGPQTEAHLVALESLAADLGKIAEAPTEPPVLSAMRPMPGPLRNPPPTPAQQARK